MPTLLALYAADSAIGGSLVGLPVQRHPDREGLIRGWLRSLISLQLPLSPMRIFAIWIELPHDVTV
jgi:hypothetical protein